MKNKRVIQTKDANGLKFHPGYPICQGCENLTIGAGWYCAFKEETEECEYPESMFKVLTANPQEKKNDSN